MELAEQLAAHEAGELGTFETVSLFAELVRTGLAWDLQGYYGRQAQGMIANGVINREGGVSPYGLKLLGELS